MIRRCYCCTTVVCLRAITQQYLDMMPGVTSVKSIEKSEGYEWQTDKLERRKRGGTSLVW